MYKTKYKIFSYIISICISISCIPIQVNAYNDDPVHNTIEDIQRYLGYMASQIGCLTKTFDYSTFIDNMETWNEWCNRGYTSVNSDGSVEFSDQAVDDFKVYLDKQIYDTGDCVFVKSFAPSKYAEYENFSVLNNFVNRAPDGILIPVCHDSAYYPYKGKLNFSATDIAFVLSDVYLVSNSTLDRVMAYNSTLNRLFTMDCYTAQSSNIGYLSGSYSLFSSDGRKIQAWKSIGKLTNYLNGYPSAGTYYTTNNYNTYNVNNDNSITINNSVVNYLISDQYVTDYDKLIADIQSGISTSDSPTPGQVQTVINNNVTNYITNITNNYGGGTNPDDPGGGDVSGNDPGGGSVSGNGVDGPQTVSLLQQILDKITAFFDYFRGVTGGSVSDNDVSGNDPGGGSGSIDLDDPDSDPTAPSWANKILKYLKIITGLLTVGTAADVVSAITSVVDSITADEVITDFASSFGEVANVMSKKFPFSIPWDIISVVSFMAAKPETPVFEIPFELPTYGISYTFVIDLSEFENVSKFSRSILSVTFLMSLIRLTILLMKKEDA